MEDLTMSWNLVVHGNFVYISFLIHLFTDSQDKLANDNVSVSSYLIACNYVVSNTFVRNYNIGFLNSYYQFNSNSRILENSTLDISVHFHNYNYAPLHTNISLYYSKENEGYGVTFLTIYSERALNFDNKTYYLN